MKLGMSTLLLAILLGGVAHSAPPVEEIVKNTIAKIESDKQLCPKFTYNIKSQSIKYDKHMVPDKVTTMTKRAYQVNGRLSEQILAMNKEGKDQTRQEIEKKVAEQNKKWMEEQKSGDKKAASRDNYVDPLTTEGIPAYSYHLIETRDSAFDVVSAAVASTGEIIDQSVNKLTTYYVIEARAIEQDEKRLNARYWIDAADFGLLRSEFQPSDMPRFVDVLEFRLEYLLINIAGTNLHVPERFEMKGKAGFLFFKGRFGAIEEYSDYRCDETIDETIVAQRYFYKPAEADQP